MDRPGISGSKNGVRPATTVRPPSRTSSTTTGSSAPRCTIRADIPTTGTTLTGSSPRGLLLGRRADRHVARARQVLPTGSQALQRADRRLDDHQVHELAVDELLERQ